MSVFKKKGTNGNDSKDYSLFYGIFWNRESAAVRAYSRLSKLDNFEYVAFVCVPMWRFALIFLPWVTYTVDKDGKTKISISKDGMY